MGFAGVYIKITGGNRVVANTAVIHLAWGSFWRKAYTGFGLVPESICFTYLDPGIRRDDAKGVSATRLQMDDHIHIRDLGTWR
jgi:hypothetical protein